MATQIPSLWPKDRIAVDTVAPVLILRAQATELERLTQGLLRAEVTTDVAETLTEAWEVHKLDIIAPAAGNLRRTLVEITHDKENVYPVSVVGYGSASSQEELVARLTEALREESTLAKIHSLLARSNANTPPNPSKE